MTLPVQEKIDLQQSYKTTNTNIIDELEKKIIDLQEQISLSQSQIELMKYNNALLEDTIVDIIENNVPPDNN